MVTVTILFTAGLLEGLTYTRSMSAKTARVGYACNKPAAGSPYRVIAVHG